MSSTWESGREPADLDKMFKQTQREFPAELSRLLDHRRSDNSAIHDVHDGMSDGMSRERESELDGKLQAQSAEVRTAFYAEQTAMWSELYAMRGVLGEPANSKLLSKAAKRAMSKRFTGQAELRSQLRKMHEAEQEHELELDLRDLETHYHVNTAALGCFNFLVGQTVFKTMFEMIMLATRSSKMNPSTALASFFMEGGLRWKALKDGVRIPYYSPDGVIKAINLIPGGFFRVGQLRLMHDPVLFNIMVAAKAGTTGAIIRLDHV